MTLQMLVTEQLMMNGDNISEITLRKLNLCTKTLPSVHKPND